MLFCARGWDIKRKYPVRGKYNIGPYFLEASRILNPSVPCRGLLFPS